MAEFVTIMHDIGYSESAGKNNVEASAKMLSSESFNVSNIINGSLSDKAVVEAVIEEVKKRFNVTATAVREMYPLIEGKMRKLFSEYQKYSSNLVNKQSFDNLLKVAEEAFNNADKKKQVTSAQPAEMNQ